MELYTHIAAYICVPRMLLAWELFADSSEVAYGLLRDLFEPRTSSRYLCRRGARRGLQMSGKISVSICTFVPVKQGD